VSSERKSVSNDGGLGRGPASGDDAMGTALVTGGARGIGRATCKALAAVGFDIAIVSLETAEEASASIGDVRSVGRKAIYFQRDIADIGSHDALIKAICKNLGTLDCLVNNAGVTSLRRGDLMDLTPESFDQSMATNLRGTFFLTQVVARMMIARKSGDEPSPYRSIVTITSANAEIVGLNRADYCMTKAALSMMSKLFAARLAQANIHAFEVRPGIIRTDMTEPATATYDRFIENDGVPLQRWRTPEDVGRTVATIALGQLPFATGEVLNVGGGLHVHRI
jgi:NAD(P)-dependent dehydrogenase (short-subunit alcohol dehydrogenase family)